MSAGPDCYDLFVSYARADNRAGWISRFIDALKEEHRAFTGGENGWRAVRAWAAKGSRWA